MEVINNKIDDLQGTVTIKITKNDYSQKVNDRLKEIRKTATLKGFRPGHVPISLVRKLYGKQVVIEEILKLLNETLENFIKENKLKLIGDFIPVNEETKFDLEKDEQYQFVYDYAVTSTPLINYDHITIPYYKAEITDEDIDKEIENILNRYGQYVEADEIKDNKNIFYLTLIELDDQGNIKEGGLKKDDILLSLEFINEKMRDLFIGKKKNDEFSIKLSELLKDKNKLKDLLQLKEQELEQIGENFKVVITEVKRFKKAELNERIFRDFSLEKEITTEQEFREVIKQLLEKKYQETSEIIFRKDAKEALMSSIEIQVPEDFVLRWLKYIYKDKKEKANEEELKNRIPKLVEEIKWTRILEQIAEDLEIKLEKADSIKTHAKLIKSVYTQYGVDIAALGEEFFKMQAEGEYEKLDENERFNIDQMAFEEKVLRELKDKVKLDIRSVSTEMIEQMYLNKVQGQQKREEKQTQEDQQINKSTEHEQQKQQDQVNQSQDKPETETPHIAKAEQTNQSVQEQQEVQQSETQLGESAQG